MPPVCSSLGGTPGEAAPAHITRDPPVYPTTREQPFGEHESGKQYKQTLVLTFLKTGRKTRVDLAIREGGTGWRLNTGFVNVLSLLLSPSGTYRQGRK